MKYNYIVKIESFVGKDTHLDCGNDRQDYLFCIVGIDDTGDAEILDNGYRSLAEAAKAWPEALNAKEEIT